MPLHGVREHLAGTSGVVRILSLYFITFTNERIEIISGALSANIWFLTGLWATCRMILTFQHRIIGVIDLYSQKMPEQAQEVCSKIVKWSIIHPLTFHLSWIQWLSHILHKMSPVSGVSDFSAASYLLWKLYEIWPKWNHRLLYTWRLSAETISQRTGVKVKSVPSQDCLFVSDMLKTIKTLELSSPVLEVVLTRLTSHNNPIIHWQDWT